MRLLIIKPSSLGDILHVMPSVDLLRQAMPEAEIDWVVNYDFHDIVAMHAGIRRIIDFPRKNYLTRIFAFFGELRKQKYDCIIDYQGLLRSGIIARCAKAPMRIGFSDAREGAPKFYTDKFLTPSALEHAVDKNLALTRYVLTKLGLPPKTVADIHTVPSQEFPCITQETKDAADALLPSDWQNRDLIGVGFSSRWQSKNWPVDFVARHIQTMAAQMPDARFFLIGGNSDISEGEHLMRLIGKANIVVNLSGRTSLPQLVCLLKRASRFVTMDSGPMHIASAVGTPCTAFFGSTSPEKTGPYGDFHQIIRSKCPLSPCFKRQCPLHSDCSRNGEN